MLPLGCLGIVLRDTVATFVHKAKGACHKLDHSLILSVEQKNLGGNTDRLAPIQKSPIPEFSMFGS